MKITDLRIRQLNGTMTHPEPFWEERLIRPIDVYPTYRQKSRKNTTNHQEETYQMSSVFLQIDTDEGVTGLSGPISPNHGYIISTQLRSILIGQDPRASELLWDQMYRIAIHGRKGDTMMAISAVDCGLWDIRGKWVDQPL